MFDLTYHNLCPNKQPPIFGKYATILNESFAITLRLVLTISFLSLIGDFMKDGTVYEDLTDFKALKKFMEDQLEDYNMEPGIIPQDLVLFRDAIEHGAYIFCRLWKSL